VVEVELDRIFSLFSHLTLIRDSSTTRVMSDESDKKEIDKKEYERAERQRVIVVECLTRWMPDIPCTSTAVTMRRWQKAAEPLRLLLDGARWWS
jgi:hypothetical protein